MSNVFLTLVVGDSAGILCTSGTAAGLAFCKQGEVVIFYGVQLFAFVTGNSLSPTCIACSGLSSHYCGAALCDVCPCVCWCGRTCAPLGTHYRISVYCCLVSLHTHFSSL